MLKADRDILLSLKNRKIPGQGNVAGSGAGGALAAALAFAIS